MLRWGIYLNQSYKEGTREGAWDCVFLIEQLVVAKNSQKIIFKFAKNVKILTKLQM